MLEDVVVSVLDFVSVAVLLLNLRAKLKTMTIKKSVTKGRNFLLAFGLFGPGVCVMKSLGYNPEGHYGQNALKVQSCRRNEL